MHSPRETDPERSRRKRKGLASPFLLPVVLLLLLLACSVHLGGRYNALRSRVHTTNSLPNKAHEDLIASRRLDEDEFTEDPETVAPTLRQTAALLDPVESIATTGPGSTVVPTTEDSRATLIPEIDVTTLIPTETENVEDPVAQECAVTFGNDGGTCASLLANTDEICDCYIFCNTELVRCDNYGLLGERQSFFCTGTTVAGCTLQDLQVDAPTPTVPPTTEGTPTVPPTTDGTEGVSVDTVARTENIRAYLIDQNISSEEDLSSYLSPQQQALTFIAEVDAYWIEVPTGNTSTPEGYAFLTRYVLTTLFYATGGDRWTFNLNFLQPFDTCYWYSVLQYPDLQQEFRGAACDQETGLLTAIYMKKNNAEGTLPAELGLLTSVAAMDFDFNNLYGSIPDSFQNLDNLLNLFVMANDLSGEFPGWMDSLSSIRNINFALNQFSGTLPEVIGNLEGLVGLALDNNLFTGSLEGVFDTSVISELASLEQLYMDRNLLTGSLDEQLLRNHSNITYLDISDNQLTGSVPAHLFDLPSLLVLDLHDNEHDSLPQDIPENEQLIMLALQKCSFANQEIPSSIANLAALEHLDVSQNAFTGSIPPHIGSMRNLTYLFLAQNMFLPGNMPDWLLGLTQLKELSLKATQRNGAIPFDLGTSLPELILLDLDDNNFEGKIPASLGQLEELRCLLLNRNNLTSAIPESFANLDNLELIFLETNTEISGDLDQLFCGPDANSTTGPVIVADCSLCDAFADCCTACCPSGVECNPGVYVADLDPIWQLGYTRIFFTFGRDDFFSSGSAYYELEDYLN